MLLLGLGLARLVRSDETHRVATVVLLDVSDSVADATLDKARVEVERLYHAKGADDVIRLVAFAARPRAVPLEQDDKLALPKTPDLRWKDAPSASPPKRVATFKQRSSSRTVCFRPAT